MQTRYITYCLILFVAGVVGWQSYQIEILTKSVEELQNAVVSVSNEFATVAQRDSQMAAGAGEIARRQQSVIQKSEGERLEDAVARVMPAVVSIVESREVALLEVEYINPFGNDPFFRDFGIKIPVYRQVGTTQQRISAGTGFIVRQNGYIVTNRHVVADADATYTILLANGKQLNGNVVWRSNSTDLAILKIEGTGYSTIPLGNSDTLRLGESVFAVGNALGEYANSVSVGIISGLNRSITAVDSNGQPVALKNVIQTDAAINRGNSGGPLVNLSGEAIGIPVAMVRGSQSIGFAIPINEVKSAFVELGI